MSINEDLFRGILGDINRAKGDKGHKKGKFLKQLSKQYGFTAQQAAMLYKHSDADISSVIAGIDRNSQ